MPYLRLFQWGVRRAFPFALCLWFGPVLAGEIEPRAYVNTPVGINFFLAGYGHTSGGLLTSGSAPVENAELTMDSGVLAYARTLDVGGNSGKVDFILSHSDLSGTAMLAGQPRERDVAGLHDPKLRFSVNFLGAPALSLQEFSSYQQDLIVGASVQVSAPLGQYDSDKLVNLGSNRWFIKPDLGLSKAWGNLAVELSTGLYLFTDNDDYFGGKTLEQEPLGAAQVHVTYSPGRGIWGALSVTHEEGGQTTVDGVRNDDEQNSTRTGATLAFSLSRNHSFKLYGSTSLHTRVGNDADLVGVVWQYRWGQGL